MKKVSVYDDPLAVENLLNEIAASHRLRAIEVAQSGGTVYVSFGKKVSVIGLPTTCGDLRVVYCV